ncbi:hypothetical protein J6590_096059 [Homalodisca vitripennis]|nr:hypothetical protein J6590_096059 [Homalodisca vitripennis]
MRMTPCNSDRTNKGVRQDKTRSSGGVDGDVYMPLPVGRMVSGRCRGWTTRSRSARISAPSKCCVKTRRAEVRYGDFARDSGKPKVPLLANRQGRTKNSSFLTQCSWSYSRLWFGEFLRPFSSSVVLCRVCFIHPLKRQPASLIRSPGLPVKQPKYLVTEAMDLAL